MADALPWVRKDADAISRALTMEGRHLFVGGNGFTLAYQRDPHFRASKPLSAYARDAQQTGMNVTA